MENVQNNWSTVTKGIYNAVLLYVWGGIAAAIFPLFAKVSDMGDMASGDIAGAMVWGLWDILELVASLAVIAGYVLFYIGLNKWRAIADGADSQAINKLRIAALLTMIAVVVAFIPGIGWIASPVLELVAVILMLMGYSALKKSATMPEGAAKGARKLYTAQVLNIVACVLGFIPVIGWIVAPILELIAFFKVLGGWKAIANS